MLILLGCISSPILNLELCNYVKVLRDACNVVYRHKKRPNLNEKSSLLLLPSSLCETFISMKYSS
jgi:hypothetical protein